MAHFYSNRLLHSVFFTSVTFKRGTDLAYFKHIFAAGNLYYGIIVTSSATDKKLEMDKKLENKLEIYGNLEIKLKIYRNREIMTFKCAS